MSIALLALLPSLLSAGIATEQDIVTIVKAFHPGMTDAELNAVCALVVAGATRHKALADADAAGPRP
jgi:hypothetical protein